MIGKVTKWQMTPEQLAEYIKKYPIRPTEMPKRSSTIHHIDYKNKIGMVNGRQEKKNNEEW